jgi:hypothetical protein
MKPPKRLFRNRPSREDGLTLVNVVTSVDQTDEELVTTARNVAGQVPGKTRLVILTISGYDDDPRELHEIPEAMGHLRRLVEFGFISILTRSGVLPELGGLGMDQRFVYGALEVWAFAEGMNVGPRLDLSKSDVDRFTNEVFPAAGEALRRNLRRYADAEADPSLILVQRPDNQG